MKQQLLDKCPKLHYIGKCIKRIKDPQFVKFVLNAERDSYQIGFSCLGEENKDKNIMIIHNIYPLNGFFAEFRCTLKLLAYADRYGFTPYILYDNNYLYFENTDVNGTKNPFEYYFEQTSGLTFHSVNNSYNVFDSKLIHSHMIDSEYGLTPGSYEMKDEYIMKLALMMKKYIRLNDETQEYITSSMQKLFLSNEKVLGIHHRGTDYKKEYKGHPKSVTLEEKIQCIKKIADQYDKIFIATDEQEALKKLEEYFGNKVCYYEDVFRGNTDVSVAFSSSDREKHKYHLGLEVLRDMYTLARCDGLIGGISQVSLCAQITKKSMLQEYMYLNIIDNGINNEGKYFKHPK